MLRYSLGSLIVVFVCSGSAAAEKIGVQHEHRSLGSEYALDLLDPSVQAAVIAAAHSDWRETAGADVWWATIGDLNVHVQVFPTLKRPGKGQAQCCLSFEQGDAEFWLKIPGLSSDDLAPGNSPADHSIPIEPPGRAPWEAPVIGGGSTGIPDAATPGAGQGRPAGGSTAGGPTTAATAGGPDAGGPGASGSKAGGSGPGPTTSTPEAIASEGTEASDVGVAQVPEPGLLVLLGIGLLTVASRVRKRP